MLGYFLQCQYLVLASVSFPVRLATITKRLLQHLVVVVFSSSSSSSIFHVSFRRRWPRSSKPHGRWLFVEVPLRSFPTLLTDYLLLTSNWSFLVHLVLLLRYVLTFLSYYMCYIRACLVNLLSFVRVVGSSKEFFITLIESMPFSAFLLWTTFQKRFCYYLERPRIIVLNTV